MAKFLPIVPFRCAPVRRACAALVLLASARALGDGASGWDLAKGFLYEEAREEFARELAADGGRGRRERLGSAVARLNEQPRTRSGVMRVKAELEGIAAEDGGDDAGILARYLLGRVLELHQQPADADGAAGVYLALVREHAGRAVAEYAASALVSLELYRPRADRERREKFRELEALGEVLVTAEGKRDYHLAMGYGALEVVGDAEGALRHFGAACREGITRPETEADVLLRAGELARALGRKGEAGEYYRRFIEKYPRNYAISMAKGRLEEVGR